MVHSCRYSIPIQIQHAFITQRRAPLSTAYHTCFCASSSAIRFCLDVEALAFSAPASESAASKLPEVESPLKALEEALLASPSSTGCAANMVFERCRFCSDMICTSVCPLRRAVLAVPACRAPAVPHPRLQLCTILWVAVSLDLWPILRIGPDL